MSARIVNRLMDNEMVPSDPRRWGYSIPLLGLIFYIYRYYKYGKNPTIPVILLIMTLVSKI